MMTTDRVQLGVRMEKDLVKVLKGLAEFNDETLGELLERIVLHSFDPVLGDEGESCASPHSKRQLEVVHTLRSMYGVSVDPHASRAFDRDVSEGEPHDGRQAE
ncbi:MAG: hypothetical protein L0H96_26315 [Humibacillus sp.]|nr:hypothetical protein [Humibacillus sp.]MDN5780389.1 hypothetical protein [Humibacillus sp.]